MYTFLGEHKADFLRMFREFVEAGDDFYFLPEETLGSEADIAELVRDLTEADIRFARPAV